MSIELTILGCHSATPRVNAYPTAQYLEINSRSFLIDCGEGHPASNEKVQSWIF